MAKSTSPKWAVIRTWRCYTLHVTKDEAEKALVDWHDGYEASGWTVSGSKGNGYRASNGESTWSEDMERASRGEKPLATRAASVVKLADHPICYIGVQKDDVDRLRALEEAENPSFEAYSAEAKRRSADWSEITA